jgi:hypothetical protein
VIVSGSIGLLNVALIFELRVTVVDKSAGVTDITTGGIKSAGPVVKLHV